MKKVFLTLAVVASLSLTSCKHETKESTTEVVTDSTQVDSTQVDTTKVDTTQVK
jgi:outer membrane biogenesis lipoprotein LolB